MESLLHLASDVEVGAGFSLSEAESAALEGASGAGSPANWSVALSSFRAVWVAKSTALSGAWGTSQGLAVASGVVLLGTGKTNVSHAMWAIW